MCELLRIQCMGGRLVAECLHRRVALCAPSEDVCVAVGCSVPGCRYAAEYLHQRVALYVFLEDD